jgi:hypothetical protein
MTDEQNAKKIELENKRGVLTKVEKDLLKALGGLRDAEASGIKIVEAREAVKVAEKAYQVPVAKKVEVKK